VDELTEGNLIILPGKTFLQNAPLHSPDDPKATCHPERSASEVKDLYLLSTN
jgi:hypothetical protein